MEELIIRSLTGATTSDEEHRLAAWRAASADNEREYRRTVKLWELLGSHGQPGRRIESVTLRGGGAATAIPRPRLRRVHVAGALLAATLAAVAIGITRFGHEPLVQTAEADRAFTTGPATMMTVHLDDGTLVRLAPDSRLIVRAGTDDRDVELSGRAFFGVAHVAGAPFRVSSVAGTVVVHGTRFDMAADEESLDVLVIDGRVTVAAVAGQAELSGGYRATARAGSAIGVTEEADVLPEWLGSALIFQETPLRRVASELSAAFGLPVVLRVDAIGDRTITAGFADQDLAEIIAVVCRVAAVHCSITAAGVVIEPGPES